MFEAIRDTDHSRLRALGKTFIKVGNDPVALLCLDHVFLSPPKLQQLSLVDIRAWLSSYLDYIRLLDRLRRDDSLAEGSKLQRLFGYQVLGEDRYLVPKHTLIYKTLTEQSGSSEENADGYACAHGELSWTITQVISNRIYDRTDGQNGACRDVHGFAPCLALIVRGQCRRGELCDFQHVQPDQVTVEWYHARVRLILLQFQILNSARFYPWAVTKYVFVHFLRCPRMLIARKVIGSGSCTQLCIHRCTDSVRMQTSISPEYPKGRTGSESSGNGLDSFAMASNSIRNPRSWGTMNASDLGLWLRACWHLTWIGKMPGTPSPTHECTGGTRGRVALFERGGTSS